MTQPSTPLSNARDRPKRRRDEKEKINEASDEAVRSFTTELEATMNNFLTTLPVRIDSLQKAASDAATLHTRLGKKQSTGNGSGVRSSSSSDTTVVTPRPFPDNTPLMEQLSSLKAVALELIPQFDAVQDWILLRVPPIKDEDNIGVEVQETVLSQMAAYYKLLKNVHNEQNEYISRRAELETNYRKQPGATSWMRAIEIHDEDEWQDVVLAWKTLQRSVILTYSILTKNMEKIKEPRQTMRMMHL